MSAAADLHPRITEALTALAALGLPDAQHNERSALCLLALLDLSPARDWSDAATPLVGITPMMEWMQAHFGKQYKPNTRETVRRQTMHQFVSAGLVQYNPDVPSRAVNSPHAVYQIGPEAHALLRRFGQPDWNAALAKFLALKPSLVTRYADARTMEMVPIQLAPGKTITLSPGAHSELIRAIIESFAPRFVPGGTAIYIGDTGAKFSYFDAVTLAALGVTIESHGKMPDVVLYDSVSNWLILIESVTSHGPVDGKRLDELERLFAGARPGLVYVTAFPSRKVMAKYLATIAWETEVWCADAPTHLVHFNGDRYLGPHQRPAT